MKNGVKITMETKNMNWLGWAFFCVFAIVTFKGITIEIHHTGDRSGPIKFEVDSPSYGSLNIKHTTDAYGFKVNHR